MAETDTLVRFETAGSIGWVTINRPGVMNALNASVLDRLSVVLSEIQSSPNVKAVIITGAGDKAFSAGADISFLNTATPLQVRELALKAVGVYHHIETFGKPVVAAINGYAFGGGLELAEACMLRVAVDHAVMGHPEVRIGAVAGWGGTTRLPRLVGKGRAAEILLTGRNVSAAEAFAIGLVNKIVPKDRLRDEATALANEIILQAPIAVNLTWEAIHRGLNMTAEESATLGADQFGLAATTDDFREGTEAFLEKKKPGFKGR